MNRTTIAPRRSHRGATLIEALIAAVVLGVSLMAAVRLQTWLHLHADQARERSAAVRSAQQEVEALRAQAVVSDLAGFDALSNDQREQAWHGAVFTVAREVTEAPGLKTVVARVAWQHSDGSQEQVQLVSALPRLSPVFTATLALPPQDQVLAVRRHLPAGARLSADGSTVLRPGAAQDIAWRIDPATGHITASCRVVGTSASARLEVASCEPMSARLVRGHVRYDLSATPDPLQARDTPMPLSVRAGATRCIGETVSLGLDRHIAYWCAVPLAQADEPTLEPQGWPLSGGAAGFKACRYPSAAGSWRNFLVIRGHLDCPAAQTPHNGAPVVTVQHQP